MRVPLDLPILVGQPTVSIELPPRILAAFVNVDVAKFLQLGNSERNAASPLCRWGRRNAVGLQLVNGLHLCAVPNAQGACFYPKRGHALSHVGV